MSSHAHTVSFGSHLAILDFVWRAPPFTILTCDASGKPGSQYPQERVGHVTSAINICRAMLIQKRVRDAFETVAVRYSFGRPNSWYLQGPNRMTMAQVTNTFIGKILGTFPRVFVDYGLNNPDQKGFHSRRPWAGDFNPGHQHISINGKRTDQMAATFENRPDENSQRLFRTFLFMTANTFLHEIGHVFTTYLTRGQYLTPPQINALSEMAPESGGEAGRAVESLIFEGTINYFHEPITGTPPDQCGTPYLKKASGSYYRISQKTIDDVASFVFKFPYDHDASAERRELRLLGEGLAQDPYTDPLEREEVAYLLQ